MKEREGEGKPGTGFIPRSPLRQLTAIKSECDSSHRQAPSGDSDHRYQHTLTSFCFTTGRTLLMISNNPPAVRYRATDKTGTSCMLLIKLGIYLRGLLLPPDAMLRCTCRFPNCGSYMTFADALDHEDGHDLIAALLKSCLSTLQSRSSKTCVAGIVSDSRVCQYNECLIYFFTVYSLHISHGASVMNTEKALTPVDLGTLEKI